MKELQEEFARRLGEADRRVSALQDDKERLRAQLAVASQGGTVTEVRLQEKDEYIAALQAEGELACCWVGAPAGVGRPLSAHFVPASAAVAPTL